MVHIKKKKKLYENVMINLSDKSHWARIPIGHYIFYKSICLFLWLLHCKVGSEMARFCPSCHPQVLNQALIKSLLDFLGGPVIKTPWFHTSSKIRNKTRVPILTTPIQHSFGSVGHSNQGRKRSKRNPDRKRRSETLTVCRWHDPLHRNP